MPPKEWIASRAEIEALLQEQELGYLGLSVDGQPYVVPVNYAYVDGRILFHCALTGRKLDCIRANPRVCFTVARQLEPVEAHAERDPCHMDSDSAICTGAARVIEDLDERKAALDAFNRRYHPGVEGLARDRVAGCAAVEIQIDEMTGRRERDHGCTFYRFER